MISRHWTGLAQKGRALEYVDHLKKDTFEQIKKIRGFAGAQILKNEIAKGTEFLIITVWDNLEAIKQFAGEDFETAVVPKVVQEIMIKYDQKVKHFEIDYQIDNDATG